RVRLARYQKHPQILADALHGEHGAVVDRGQFALGFGGLDLDDVSPAARDLDRHGDVVAAPDVPRRGPLAVPADGHRNAVLRRIARLPFRQPHILDTERDRLLLADDAEARRGMDHQPAVALVLFTGQKGMHGRIEAHLAGTFGYVVNLSVGD